MKIKTVLVFLSAIPFFLLGCSLFDPVSLNGIVTMDSEVNTDFTDPGITAPNGYTIITNGTVNTTRLGQYTLSYSVLNKDGETVKEMTRFVNVVDTTPPEISLPDTLIIYYGVPNDYIKQYCTIEDNYDEIDDLEISINIDEVTDGFTPGTYTIKITIEDLSGNSTEVDMNAELRFDIFEIIETLDYEENGITRLISDEGPKGEEIIWILFENGDSAAIQEDNKIHYFYRLNSNYSYASLSASWNYGEVDTATLIVSISRNSDSSSGSVHNFDMTIERETLELALDSYINCASISEEIATQLLNNNGLELIVRTKYFIENILHLIYK